MWSVWDRMSNFCNNYTDITYHVNLPSADEYNSCEITKY